MNHIRCSTVSVYMYTHSSIRPGSPPVLLLPMFVAIRWLIFLSTFTQRTSTIVHCCTLCWPFVIGCLTISCFLLVGHSQGQVLSHAMNGSTSHPQRPLSPPSYPPPPASLHTGLPRQSRSSGESLFFCLFAPRRDASHCTNAWLGKW